MTADVSIWTAVARPTLSVADAPGSLYGVPASSTNGFAPASVITGGVMSLTLTINGSGALTLPEASVAVQLAL